jgi:cell division septum initiation protein DivIVA
MSGYQPDAQAGQPNAEAWQYNWEGPPAFRVVRRGYDRDQVDAAFSQLTARLQQAVDRHAKGEQARTELQREVTSLQQRPLSFEELGGEAAAVLQEAGRSAEQLVENARRRAETIIEKAQQQAQQVRTDVTSEAQRVLEQAREVAEQIRREVEQERATVLSEIDQVREFRDGLLNDLGRVHGEITGLLERTFTEREQAAATPDAKANKPAAPAKAAERK